LTDYTVVNLKADVEDMAPRFGYAPNAESRFARKNLGLEKSGLSHFKLAANFDFPFGHTHTEQEEVYVVIRGSARIKLGDEVIEVGELDAVRVPPGVWRSFGGGPEGAEILAFGAPNTENKDAEMDPQFWG
jgi:mannose-6-phosphate isomerase-like protein (cupin superfamily)